MEVSVGAATVTRIEESWEPNFDAATFFPDWSPDVVERHGHWMAPNHYDHATRMLKLSVHSWLLRVGGRRILIDTCVGNHKPRPNRPKWHLQERPYLQRLAAAGVKPEEIDMVMCTHLHVDHVGWNTQLDNGRWVPTFPNARYVFSQTDFDHFNAEHRAGKGPVGQGSFEDSVLPVVDAGLAHMVSGASAIEDGLSVAPAPGHTPGHVVFRLASQGQEAAFCGDVLHHLIQLHHPEWNSFACMDQETARITRRRLLEDCAGSGALLMPCHFGAPFVCHVEAQGEAFAPRFPAA